MISQRIEQLQETINALAEEAQRPKDGIKIIAVSKGESTVKILQTQRAGIFDFGESYVQEALPKIEALKSIPLVWHFIGPIQSNKTQAIAEHFSWVHSVGRLKIAEGLNQYRPTTLPKLNICIQVNLDNEMTKSGIPPHHLADLVQAILPLPHLTLRGLMCIPRPTDDENEQFQQFSQLKQLMHELSQRYNLSLDTLSMGMSNDYPAAIRAGSTMVRIGRGIFAGN